MKNIFLIIVTCFTLSAFGQAEIVQDINSTKTANHINIPGTRVFIIPPPGFQLTTSFFGLQKGETSVFQIYDLVGGNYYTNAASFSEENFRMNGAKIFDFREFKVNGFPAKYVFMETASNEKAISLVFGDSTFSTMIMAVYPSTDYETGEQIENAIKTIYYDKDLKIDPFATAAFRLDESKSIFKFSKSVSGMFLYTINGVDNESSQDAPLIYITTIPKDPTMTAKSISDMLIANMKKYGLTEEKLTNISTKKVNGYQAYEVEIYGKMEGESSLIYQLIVLGKDKAITIQGVVKSDFDKNLIEMKRLAKTIKLK
jgi:hypothetical protein